MDPTPDPAPRRRGLGPAFWAMIAFGLACAVAGGVVGFWGPELFPKKPASALAGPSPRLRPRPSPAQAQRRRRALGNRRPRR